MAGYTFTAKKPKDPDALLPYPMNWKPWLAGSTLAASTWTVISGDVEIDDDLTDFNSTSATVWLSGGTAGEWAIVVNHITAADGREDDRSLRIKIEER